MVLNPVSLTRKTPLLCRFVGFTHSPISQFSYKTRIPIDAVQKSGFRAASLCLGNGDSGSRCLFKCSLPSTVEDRQLRFDRFRLFSVSGGGSGGGGDGKGGFGGGNSGGGDGGDGAGGNGSWSFVLWYLGLLAKYPVLTKAVTSAILTLFGDLICQLVIDQVSSLDSKRTFLFTFLGMVLVGPTLHFWYLYLSKLVTMPGASGAFLRLILDQFLFAPMFIGLFMSTLLTLEGRPSQVVPKLQQEWFSAVLANWQLWIPFQFLNFRFVPQQFQVLAANAVALAWNVILSFKAHKEVLAK